MWVSIWRLSAVLSLPTAISRQQQLQQHRHVAITSAIYAHDTEHSALWKLSVLFKSIHVLDIAGDDTKSFYLCRFHNGESQTVDMSTKLSADIGAPVYVVNLLSRRLDTAYADTAPANRNHSWTDRGKRYDNFVCSNHIANLLFHAGDYATPVVFLGNNLILGSSSFMAFLRDTFYAPHTTTATTTAATNQMSSVFLCAPRVNIRLNAIDLIGGATCELDFIAMLPTVGHKLYTIVNATIGGIEPSCVDHMLALGAGRAYHSLTLTDDSTFPILRAGQYWHQHLDTIAFLVEFDGYQHELRRTRKRLSDGSEECLMNVHVEWDYFQAVPAVGMALEYIFADPALLRSFAGCSPLPEMYHRHVPTSALETATLPTPATPATPAATDIFTTATQPSRVIDGILFFDEISMLRLRLLALRDVVDHHVIVESNRTFTGKPKPLYFVENMHLFEEFMPRITHIVVEQMARNEPEYANHVWENEYFSRDAVRLGLTACGATDEDIILVADTDEIPHPEAILNLRAKVQHARYVREQQQARGVDTPLSPQVYKLFVDNYLYHFDCYVGEGYARGTPLTATTIGDTKRIVAGYVDNIALERFVSFSRLYWQHEVPLRFENVISPGGWHLSFFENVDRIKRKLESYGHQNFIKQFSTDLNDTAPMRTTHEVDVAVDGEGQRSGEVAAQTHAAKTSAADKDVYLSKEIPRGVEISTEAIAQRVAAGSPIDYRQVKDKVACQADRWTQDAYGRRLKALWETIATPEDRVQ